MLKALLILITFFYASLLKAQLSPVIDSIPMRDGKKLAADVYIPQGCSHCPAILIQTPYNRQWYRYSLPLGTGLNLNASPYIFVIIDWRGFYGSNSAAILNPNRGEDGYDAVEWIAAQSWSDGKIGTWGHSALGKVQFLTAKENPPHLVCAVPLVAGPQMKYEEYYPGGVYRTEYVEQLDNLGFGLSSLILAHKFYDYFWQYTESSSSYPASINVPMLMIGGWYDHNTGLMIEFFNSLRQSSPVAVRDKHKLLMGPWAHGGFGLVQVGSCTQGQLTYNEACGESDSLALDFFDFYLRNIGNGWEGNPVINYFQMGENLWQGTASWPPSGSSDTKLYLHNNGNLNAVIPANSTGSSTLTYDPHNPSPTAGGSTLRQDLQQGPYDQAPLVESRNDVQIFTTDVLSNNVALKGSPVAHLFVSTDRKDTDFAIRLTDVYPDGRSMLVADGIKRLRFRNGFATTDTSSALPGQVYELTITLPPTAITFLAGHKIRVDITSSNYPRFDNNLNNGGAMYVAGDTLVATNTIQHNSISASYMEFPFTGSVPFAYEPANDVADFVLSPNPASDYTTLSFNAAQNKDIIIEIFTGDGKVRKVIAPGKSIRQIVKYSLNTTDLCGGIYFLKISCGETTYFKKLVVLNK